MDKHFCEPFSEDIQKLILEGKYNIIPKLGTKQEVFEVIRPSPDMIQYISNKYKPYNIFATECQRVGAWAEFKVISVDTRSGKFGVYKYWSYPDRKK